MGILALQTRGQAYQKAAYRLLATIVEVVASFVIGFADWLGLCIYVGGLLDGNRATAPSFPAIRLPWSL